MLRIKLLIWVKFVLSVVCSFIVEVVNTFYHWPYFLIYVFSKSVINDES